MKSHLQYLSYVLIHKWHVAYAGWYLRVPIWRLITHDWTKFTPAEWGPYVRRFFGGRGSQWEKEADPTEFHMAWRHHWTRNPHHWEYWLPEPVCEPKQGPLPMPETYVCEMVADWYGAGMALGKPDIEGWYDANCDKMLLHPHTRVLIDRVIGRAKLLRLF